MTSLAARQQRFISMLYREAAPADARLAIYHRAVRANWRRALEAAYPVVRRLVGASFFEGVAEAYAGACPSASGDLGAYGARLPAFLAGYAPASGLDYLPDVARLEWAIQESFEAADAPGFDFAALAAVPPQRHGRIRLRLHPAARLLRSSHPVLAIWEANQPDRDGTPARAAGGDRILVARDGFTPRPRALPEGDWLLLEQLAAGATLDEACVALGARAQAIPRLVASHAAQGVICGFSLAA